MARLNELLAQEIELEIAEGTSLNKISQAYNIAKSTLYYYYKRINGKKTKQVTICFKSSSEIGEFLGIFSGDGSFFMDKKAYHYSVRVFIGAYEKRYAYYLSERFNSWFSKQPRVYKREHNGKPSVIIIEYYSKGIYSFLKDYLVWEGKKGYTIRLKKLDFVNKEFNLGFLRGLFDTDGNWYAPKKRVSLASVSKELIEQAKLILIHNCGLQPKCFIYKKAGCADLYTLTLHGVNAKRFIELVKPSNPNKSGSGPVWLRRELPNQRKEL